MISSIRAKLSSLNPVIVFLMAALLIGGFIRLMPVLRSALPLNDGGLFYTMTQDLMKNGFRLPVTTSYNHLGYPFAYPPLPFYLAGWISYLTSVPLIELFRYVPAVFTILAIPAFYLLARQLIKNQMQLIFALLIFTLMPTSFDWLVMGGGLTRSMAFFFSLLTLYFAYRMYTKNRISDIVWSAVFGTLTVLSHPEAALHTAASAAVLWFFFGRNRKGTLNSLIVAAAIAGLTSPWWITVLSRFGLTPFSTAAKTGLFGVAQLLSLLEFNFTHEYGLTILAVLSLVGIFLCLKKRDFFLPVWVLVTFLVEPRSAPLFLIPAEVLLASSTLLEILQLLEQPAAHPIDEAKSKTVFSPISTALLLLIFYQCLYSSLTTIDTTINNVSLSAADIRTFEWIRKNTPQDAHFAVLTGKSPMTDAVSEWFPALSERMSVGTTQGTEWKNSGSFEETFLQSLNLQNCLDQSYTCLANWVSSNHKTLDYLYLSNAVNGNECTNSPSSELALGQQLQLSGIAELVYSDQEISVYKLK